MPGIQAHLRLGELIFKHCLNLPPVVKPYPLLTTTASPPVLALLGGLGGTTFKLLTTQANMLKCSQTSQEIECRSVLSPGSHVTHKPSPDQMCCLRIDVLANVTACVDCAPLISDATSSNGAFKSDIITRPEERHK